MVVLIHSHVSKQNFIYWSWFIAYCVHCTQFPFRRAPLNLQTLPHTAANALRLPWCPDRKECHEPPFWNTSRAEVSKFNIIMVNYTFSLTWNKAILGWFPLLTMISVQPCSVVPNSYGCWYTTPCTCSMWYLSIYIYTTINQTNLAKDWRPSSPHYCPKHMNKVVKRIRSHPQFTMASMGRIEIHGFSSIWN